MTIKILIERKFKDEPSLEEIKAINEIRMGAMQRRGYVSGETIIDMNDYRRIIVISVWSDKQAWEAWANSEERKSIEAKLTNNLKQQPIIRSFMLGADYLGGVFDEVMHESETRKEIEKVH